jgi:hypothetical protein
MKIKYIFLALTLLSLSACDDHQVFNDEQYKNVFGFICNSDNVQTQMFTLTDDTSTGYISFSMGGSNKTTEDVTIDLVEDSTLIDTYNKNTYDRAVEKFAHKLPKANYDMSSLTCVIKAGETNGTVPVTIRPEGLSPDTVYFLPVRVSSYKKCELNPEKSTLLYQVTLRNKWAKGDGSSTYTMSGLRAEEGSSEINMPGSKVMYPLSRNTVRIMAGNESYDASIETFNKSGLILQIDDNGNVTITPYRDMKVTQLSGDADYPNTFRVVNDGYNYYKTFLLHYRYQVGTAIYEMKEELRLQFNPEDADEDLKVK